MKLWIDTEFNEYRGALISLALVAEDGREWYGVRFCDDPGFWVSEHVMPYLNQEPQRDTDLRTSLNGFLCGFDSVHIVSDWPGDIAYFCNFLEYRPGDRIGPDRMTFEVRRDLPDTATTSTVPHNAREDARALAKGALMPTNDEIGSMTTLIERLRSRYMDTKQMLPCELEHEAADELERLTAEVAVLREDAARYWWAPPGPSCAARTWSAGASGQALTRVMPATLLCF